MSTPSPDALRLSRLDRLISQLGEHQLSIRQQGTSVTDMESRLTGLEKRVADDMQALWPLRELDVAGELTGARAAIDKLAKQVALLGRDQEEGRIQAEKRMQQVEARQAELERQVAGLAQQVDATSAEAAAAVEELRLATKDMLTEVIGRIADQFEALQAALDEAIQGRHAEAEERQAAAHLLQDSLEAQRQWVQQQAEGWELKVKAALEAATTEAAAAAAEQQRGAAQQLEALQAAAAVADKEAAGLRAGVEAVQQQLAEQQQQLAAVAAVQEQQADGLQEARQQLAAAQSSSEAAAAALQQQVEALTSEQAAAAERQAASEGLLRQALNVWQQGLEEQLLAVEGRLTGQLAAAQAAQKQLGDKFEEYKGYVKRLRRQVAEARAEQEANTTHISAVRRDFDAAHSKMEQVQAEAAALGDGLLEVTAAATAAGSTLRRLSTRTTSC